MAGVAVELKGFDEARDLLRGMMKKTDNLKPLMEDIGEKMVPSTQKRLADEKQSPAGVKWASYKNADYAITKAKKSSGGLLEHSGDLIRGIITEADKDNVQWGSAEEYAATHQFGHGEIVARPFLGISDKDHKIIKRLIRQYYDEHHH